MRVTLPRRRAHSRARGAIMRLLALLATGLAACRGTMSLEQFDHLARTTGARTILHEQDFSLYSPFPLNATREWLQLVEQQVAEVAELLEADPGEHREREGVLIVRLRAVEGLRGRFQVDGEDSFRMDWPESHPLHGLEGYATSRLATVMVEAPTEHRLSDGRTLSGSWAASTFQPALRHELAHVVAHSEGIHGEAWLAEGVAVLVEHTRRDGDGLAVDPDRLRIGLELARTGPALDDLLLVEEATRAIEGERFPADPHWRPRLLAFFAFLLERELARGGNLRSTLEAAQRAGRDELVRLEPEWQAWLESHAESRSPIDAP